MACAILTKGLIKTLHHQLTRGELDLAAVRADARRAESQDRQCRAYLWRPEAEGLTVPGGGPGPLHGLPVSVKDNMDVAGWPTSCGAKFFAAVRAPTHQDANFVAMWRQAGADFTGKTHLNAFAYGLTGENRDYGDCLQPGHPGCLTGGSSSGAAASVMSGSAVIGLGTDTGGSLRVPAALCGLVSLRLTPGRASNTGWFPLAETYTGGGWIQRHLADVAWVARQVLGLAPATTTPRRVGLVEGTWLDVCEPKVRTALADFMAALTGAGFEVAAVDADGWEEAAEVFIPLQAREAFQVHEPLIARHAAEYESTIRTRLELGRDLSPEQHACLIGRRDRLVARCDELWLRYDLLVAPACPVTRLAVGVDHGVSRRRMLQLTTPASLARWPALTVPGSAGQGLGFQVLAPRGEESRLLSFAEQLGAATSRAASQGDA
ncbi:MAG: amidase [Limisphaerales bacterium]